MRSKGFKDFYLRRNSEVHKKANFLFLERAADQLDIFYKLIKCDFCIQNISKMSSEAKKDVDIFRDTPVRLLGYSNEVGEAFRALVHVNWVRASYGLASAYVLADTNDKAGKAVGGGKEKAVAAFDTLVWQALASVMIPGFTINRVCAFSLMAMAKTIPQEP